MSSTENMGSSPRACGGLPSRLMIENNRSDQEEQNLCNRAAACIFTDGFMVADVNSMTQKFGWWNVVDGAMLQRFSYNKPTNASERWFRLEKKAAKVGKGLVKNGKGRKLVSQHWLEAIDPLHRYGHNLRFYFEEWCQSDTNEPFFHWLDSGEGKDLDLEVCSRATLQDERIRYLGPREREQYEVTVEDGKLIFKQTKEPVNTTKGDKWIFVMSTSGVLYVGKKERGSLQHSSFLAGAAITSAGRLRVRQGIIQLIEAHSGHYRPTPENFKQLVNVLESRGADLTEAKIQYSSKEMLKPSQSLKCNQMAANGGEKDEGSLNSEGCGDAAGGHSADECTDEKTIRRDSRRFSFSGEHDGRSAGECTETENTVRGLRQFSFSGKHDIYKGERRCDEVGVIDDSDRTSTRSLATDNKPEQRSGSLPQVGCQAYGTEWTADFTERSHVMAEVSSPREQKVFPEGQWAEHLQGSRMPVQISMDERPSRQEEKVVQVKIEEVFTKQIAEGPFTSAY